MNPQYEAHERMCKSIGDMAKENERLQERIKQLEDAMGIANTLLQLVMCEQNHLRDLRNKANDRIKLLEEELMDANNKYAVLVADVALYEDRGERIKRLEEAGDEAIYKTNLFDREAHWNKAKEAKP
jgi:chromosome segregation ATPase